MQSDLRVSLEQYKKRNRSRSIWRKIVRFLACIVVFCTTYALILPALTMEQATYCGHDDHIHNEECYLQAAASTNLICTPESVGIHTHTVDCIDEFGNIICGLIDYVAHTHTADCYNSLGNLVCTFPETPWHVHDETCLVPIGLTTTCNMAEGDIHYHNDSCYTINISFDVELGFTEETVLSCQFTEGETHFHTDLCYEYQEDSVFVCAPHVHTPLCYDAYGELVCGLSDKVAHVHDAEYCYDEFGTLVCSFAETQEHVHTETCFAQDEQPLVCTFEENEFHTHNFLCYGTWELICLEEEHSHELVCFSNPEADLENIGTWESSIDRVDLIGVWADDVVAIAESQIGYTESELNYIVLDDGVTALGYTRYGEWYGAPYDNWDAMFASFCLNYAGVEGITFNNNAAAWVNDLYAQCLYRAANEYTPNHGDLVFFDVDGDAVADRVGIIAEVISNSETEPLTILTVEGDLVNSVQYMAYRTDAVSILGYGTLPKQIGATYNYNYFDGNVEVAVEIPVESGVPSDAILSVTPIDTLSANYDELLSLAEAAVDGSVAQAQFYDISFFTDELEYIPVSDSARVTMRFTDGTVNSDANTVVLHYDENEALPTVIDNVTVEEQTVLSVSTFSLRVDTLETTETVLSFETEGFSVFAVVEVSNPCKLLETDITATKQVDPGNSQILMYTLPTQVTVNDPNNENTVVVHIKGTTPGAFRTWLCNDYSNRRASAVQTLSGSDEFEYFIEYTANSPESDLVTVANYVEFKDQANLNLTHVGVYYGTLAEYEAERAKFGGSADDGNGEEVETTPGEVISSGEYRDITNGTRTNVKGYGFGEGAFPNIGTFDDYSISISEFIAYAQTSGAKLWLDVSCNDTANEVSFNAQFNWGVDGATGGTVDFSKVFYRKASINNETQALTSGNGQFCIALSDVLAAYTGDVNAIQNFTATILSGDGNVTLNKAWITVPATFEDDEYQIYELDNAQLDNGGHYQVALSDGRVVDGWTAFLTYYVYSGTEMSNFKTAIQTPGAQLKVTYTGGDSNAIRPILQSNKDWRKAGTVDASTTTTIEGTNYKVSTYDCAALIENFNSQDIGTITENIGNFGFNGNGVIYKVEVIVPPIEDVLFESEEGEALNKSYWEGFGIGEQVQGVEIGNYSLDDIKTLATDVQNGADIKLIIEFTSTDLKSGISGGGNNEPMSPMQTQFNAFGDDYATLDKLLEVSPDWPEEIGTTADGKLIYRTTLNIKDIVDKLPDAGLDIGGITNIGVQLFCTDCVLHKVSFTMPESTYDKLVRDPVDSTLVTNLNGQIGIITAVNNLATQGEVIYPAIASSVNGTELIGSDLDRVTVTNGTLGITDNDYSVDANGDIAGVNRIVWQFEAVPDKIGQYYIKVSNYYSDNTTENPNVGQYLTVTENGLTLSETPQAIEVVKVTPDSNDANVLVTENVVALRANVNGTTRYITLGGNDGSNNFSSTANTDTSNLATHFVIADIADEEVLKLREDIDALPLTSEFNNVINSISVSGGEASEKAGYDQRVAKREEIRAAAVAAKKLYDQLVKEYAGATDASGNSVDEVALLKNLIGKERVEKLLELEWLYRETPKLVNAVDVDVTVKMFNYGTGINNHLFNTNASVTKPETVGYKFYNASSSNGASDEYRFPGSWNTAKGQGDGSSPTMSATLGPDGYPLILEVPAVIGKEDGSENDNYENVAVTDGTLAYLFADKESYSELGLSQSYQVGDTMTDGGGLFQQDSEGYYYYYSDTNAAYFNPVTNRFELYDVVTRPAYENNNTNEHSVEALNDRLSNFLPFNEILEHNDDGSLKVVDGEHVSKVIYDYPDTYDDIDYSLAEDSTYYVDTVTSNAEGNAKVPTTYVNDRVDLWFGMTLEYDFFIPQDGKTNGNDMIFEFHGDDDVMVYVDGVLLLDISGCHAAMDGHINFATGEVYYQNNNGTVHTTIHEIFKKAPNYNSRLFDGDTFKDYTIHNLQFFYLERGGSISYNGMRFNLPPIPDYNLMVAKELYHKTGDNKAESDEDFTFRVVKASNPEESLLPAFTPFDIYENGVKVGTGTLDSNCLFTIKAGQVAVFPKIEGDELNHELYIVQELMTTTQDETYGQISYRTDSTEGDTLKDVINVSALNILSFYRSVLMAEGDTTEITAVSDKVVSGYTLFGVGRDHNNTYNDFTTSIDSIKNYINTENACFKIDFTYANWYNSFKIFAYYLDNTNQIQSYEMTMSESNGMAQADLASIKNSINVDNLIGFVVATNSDNLTITKAYFEVPTTSSGSSCNGDHNFTIEQSRTEATCGENGSVTYKCSNCDETKTEEIPATGNHDYVLKNLGDGTHILTCSCGATTGNAEAHTFGNWFHDGNAVQHHRSCSCGYIEYQDHDTIYSNENENVHRLTCSVCGATITESHTWDGGVTVDGTTTYTCTAGCGATKTETSHTHSYTSNVTTAATCTTAGVRTYTCSCGDSYTEEIAATGHTDSNSDNVCDTCGASMSGCQHTSHTTNNNNDGTHIFKCNDCDYQVAEAHEFEWTVAGNETEHVGRCACGAETTRCTESNRNPNCTICNNSGESHEHSYDSGVVTTPATCTQQGVMTYTCSCGDSYTETIAVDANAHNLVWNYNSDNHWQTCSLCQTQFNEGSHTLEKFYDEYNCGTSCTCGYKVVNEHVYVDATNNGDNHTLHCNNCDHDIVQSHQWNSGVITTAPTYENTGVLTYTCTTTGCGATKTTTIPMLETTGKVTIDGIEYITYSTKALELNDPSDPNYASTVIFENRLSTDPSNLKVTKTGNGIDANEEFDMQILIGSGNIARASLSPIKQGTPYIIRENGKADVNATVGANGIITLKVNQTAIIEGLAPGIFVEVVEVLGSGQNYTPTYSEIIDVDEGTLNDSKIGENGTAVIASGDTVHITVNNVINEGKVIIPVTKTLKDMQGSTATFNFKVEHGTWNGTTWTLDHAHDGTSISFGTLWGDNTITTDESNHIVLGYNATNTPSGTATYQYKIYEQNAGGDYVYDDTFYIIEVEVNNYNATVQRILKNGTEDVTFSFNDDTDLLSEGVIAFTNYTTAKLQITKSVVGADKSGEFTFNAVVTGDVTNYLDKNSTEYTFELKDNTTVITFKLAHGESIVLNLPNYAYVYVNEVDAQGCAPTNVLIQDNKVVTQEGMNGKAQTVGFNVSPNYTTYVNYTNVKGYNLPKTGSALTPNNLYIAGGLILLAISAVLLYNKTNCRKEDRASS